MAIRSEAMAGSPTSIRIIGEFNGGKAVLKKGETVIASSDTSPLTLVVSNADKSTTYAFVVTNETGAFVSNTFTVTLGPASNKANQGQVKTP
jgi:hypothetical protein